VERNRKAGQNPPKVVAPIEEEEVKSLKEIRHLEDLSVDGRTTNCSLRLLNDDCGLDTSRSGHGPVATLVSRNGLVGST
jgi:hypothetical protein